MDEKKRDEPSSEEEELEGLNAEKDPEESEKEIIDALENNDFQRLEALEEKLGGFNELEGKRLFQLWKASEFLQLDKAVEASGVFTESKATVNATDRIDIAVKEGLFFVTENVVARFKDFIDFVSAKPSFRNTSPTAEVGASSQKKEKMFVQIDFGGVLLEAKGEKIQLNVLKPLRKLAVFVKKKKTPFISLHHCENVTIPLPEQEYTLVINNIQYHLVFKKKT